MQNTNVKIICTGVVVGRLSIPEFTLHKNEILCMKLPRHALSQTENNTLFNILLKKRHINGLQIFGNPSRIGVLALTTSFFFRYKWYKKTVFEYLKAFTNLTSHQIEKILNNINVSLSTILGLLGCSSQRLLIEIEIACNHSDIIIFSTEGLAPLGCHMIVEHVKSKLSKISAICICFPLIDNDTYHGVDSCSDTSLAHEKAIYITQSVV